MINSDIQKLNPGSLVDMYELDSTSIGGGTLMFHAGVSELGNDIVWQGNTYTRYPIIVEGFEKSGQGSIPRPKIKAANITGAVSALAKAYQDLVGSKLIRRRTFLQYLDAVNFADGNPLADPNVHFPDEVWFVDRKSHEGPMYLEFELSAAFDVSGVMLPRRQCIQNTCPWKYRGPECGYTGDPVATHTDQPTTNPLQDRCGKRLSSCKIRFGSTSELPFGGFPGVGLVR